MTAPMKKDAKAWALAMANVYALSTTQKLETALGADMASAIQQSAPGAAVASSACASAAPPRASRKSSRVSCYVEIGRSLRLREPARNLTGSPRVGSVDGTLRGRACNGRGSQVVAQGRTAGRSTLYGDAETYVLMEPGEDEQFVTAEELQEKLKKWLQEWPGEELPIDLTKFKNVDEAVQFLVNAVCELDLGDGQGSLQCDEEEQGLPR